MGTTKYTHIIAPERRAVLVAAQTMLQTRKRGQVYAAVRLSATGRATSLKGEEYPATYVDPSRNETHVFWRADSPLLQDVIELCREFDIDPNGMTLGKLVRAFCTNQLNLYPHKYRYDKREGTRTDSNEKTTNVGFFSPKYYRMAKSVPTTHWHYLRPNNEPPLMQRPDWIVNVDIKGAYFASLVNGSKSLILQETSFSLQRSRTNEIRERIIKRYESIEAFSQACDVAVSVIENFLSIRQVAASDFERLCQHIDIDWWTVISPNISNPRERTLEWLPDGGALERLRSHSDLLNRYKRFRLALLGMWAQYQTKWFGWDKTANDGSGGIVTKSIPDIAWGGVFNATHAAVWRLERQMDYVHRLILQNDCVGANTDAFWIKASCPESKLIQMERYLAERGYTLTVKRWGHGFVWDASCALVLQPDSLQPGGVRAFPVGEDVEINDALSESRWWNVSRQDEYWKRLVVSQGVPNDMRKFERFGWQRPFNETILDSESENVEEVWSC